ncbi:hypothetical protein SFRURICE_011070 [Spodoptera frugiperda]|uniref:SFRICE_022913 n=1 Tax=Spodoptera frugiperda TaxID=7108 RepID=A0A2H1WIH0_SPOFR|nr:hypothetical protein SFRURICE_011070 [Spodoptera frugiperda]
MANNCASCNKPVKATHAKCTQCELVYHYVCVNLSNTSKQLARDWLCPLCQPTVLNITRSPGPALSPLSTTTQSSDSEVLRSLACEMKLLRGDVSDLKQHINDVSEHLKRCYTRLDEYDTRIKTLEKREEEIICLNNTISNLREQLNTHTQASIQNEIEISGINEYKNENPMHTVRVIAHKIGISIDDQDIDYVSRAGPRRQQVSNTTDNLPRNLIVRFVRRHQRDNFLKAAKTRSPLHSTDIEISGPNRQVYINERLTPGNRQLFRAARVAAKEHGYRYCWCRNGAILIRKQEGNPPIRIRNSDDLDRYLGPYTASPASTTTAD